MHACMHASMHASIQLPTYLTIIYLSVYCICIQLMPKCSHASSGTGSGGSPTDTLDPPHPISSITMCATKLPRTPRMSIICRKTGKSLCVVHENGQAVFFQLGTTKCRQRTCHGKSDPRHNYVPINPTGHEVQSNTTLVNVFSGKPCNAKTAQLLDKQEIGSSQRNTRREGSQVF